MDKYSSLKNEEISNDSVQIAGRVYSKRLMGKSLRFFDLRSEIQKIQVMATARYASNLTFISKKKKKIQRKLNF